MHARRDRQREFILAQISTRLPKASQKAYHLADQQGRERKASVIFPEPPELAAPLFPANSKSIQFQGAGR